MVITILLVVVFSGCEEIERGIMAKKLDEKPENFITVSEEQMINFPHLKEAIFSDKIVITPLKEYKEIDNFLKETRNIKYLNEFYEIFFAT